MNKKIISFFAKETLNYKRLIFKNEFRNRIYNPRQINEFERLYNIIIKLVLYNIK